MSEENETPEGEETPAPEPTAAELNAQELATLATDVEEMDAEALSTKYKGYRTEFDYLATQPATPSTGKRKEHLAELMKTVSGAYAAATASSDAPELETPKTEEPASDEPATEEPKAEDDKSGDAPATEEPKADEAPKAEEPKADDLSVTPTATAEDLKPVQDAPADEGTSLAGSTATVGETFSMATPGGEDITSLEEFGMALQKAASTGRHTKIGSFNPYGSASIFNKNGVLTRSAEDNYRTMFGQDQKERQARVASVRGKSAAEKTGNGFTAALNCAGPAEVVSEIPFTFSAGRPLFDSGLVGAFPAVNGQIQVYDCHTLPEFPEGILEPVDGCVDCATCPDVTCAVHTCITPGDPIQPDRYLSCMCLPEELQFANELVLEQAMIDFAVATDRAYELFWMRQLKELSLNRTIDGAGGPHGADSTIRRSMWQVKSRLALNARENEDSLADYTVFVPGGEAMFCAAAADKASRILGAEMPGEDILQMLSNLTGGNVVFGLDMDPTGAQLAAFPNVWDDTTVGSAAAAPLESMVDVGSIALIPRDTFITASPLTTEIALDFEDRCSHASGCMKMQRAEWWFPVSAVGCRDAVWMEFSNLCYEGSGPDLLPSSC